MAAKPLRLQPDSGMMKVRNQINVAPALLTTAEGLAATYQEVSDDEPF